MLKILVDRNLITYHTTSIVLILMKYWPILSSSIQYCFMAGWCCQPFSDSYPIPAQCGTWHIYNNCYVSTAQYFGATIFLLSISTALTVLVLNVHHRGSLGNPVPPVVQLVVLDWLAKILRVGQWGKNKRQSNSAKMVRVNRNLISQHGDDGQESCLIRATLLEWCFIKLFIPSYHKKQPGFASLSYWSRERLTSDR